MLLVGGGGQSGANAPLYPLNETLYTMLMGGPLAIPKLRDQR